ncbi:MAG: hypothetical protein E3J72_16990 [Planctomycetota bacterium]|nr:MAG: hypothetical protein E3J72_16990 [Planctomycetota bacterium]
MKLYYALPAVAALFLLIPAAVCIAGGDVITLKDGTKIEGEIVAKTEKQVVIKVGDELKTFDRSEIKSIEKKEESGPKKKDEPEPGRGDDKEDAKAKEEAKKKTRGKDLIAVKQLYRKWMRNRKDLLCRKCGGDGQLTCKLCKGQGWYRSASVGGGQGRVKCHDCSWKGKFDCKTCKKTGRNLSKVKVLFWDILEPDYKEREGVESDKDAALEKGILAAQNSGGFAVELDLSKLTKKFNLIKDLEYTLGDDCAAVTWTCKIGDESWEEGLYFSKVGKKWYWVPDMGPDEIPDEDEDEDE